ncbi:hypothetical protein [Nucisporomicrobium flavum]|uniref:hypothetical protein n=1 Tax=Nucisporomicrobium flavum TaxID=2785915 RepID=UPI0018F2D752|nr:hypothetical protein [Nucisporomicrobium flavum]
MSDPPGLQRQNPLNAEDRAAGEQYADDHDPGRPEDYAGDPVPDPWEEEPDGQLDSGAVPGSSS